MGKLQLKSLRDLDSEEGTVKLVDEQHQLKDVKNSDIALVPQPSDDINDPLNWPKWKKAAAFSCIVYFAMLGSWIMGGVVLGIPAIIQEFGITLNDAIDGLISWIVLTLGLGNFFWTPVALYIGKRPVFLFVSFLSFAGSIWCAKAQSWPSLEAARIVSALAYSACESLCAGIEADIFFLHERGVWMGIYLIGLLGGVSLGGLMSGFIINSLGWRWHFWVGAIASGVCAVAFFLLFPETQYKRSTPGTATPAAAAVEKEADSTNTPSDEVPAEESSTSLTGTKKSFLQELSPFNPIDKDKNLLLLFLKPLPLFAYPAVFYGAVAFGTSLAFLLAGLTVNPSIYQAPPYNFSPAVNGLINIPSFIGHVLGAFAGGWLTDKIAEIQARKNNGVFEPEFRLMALILPLFIYPAGCLMFGFGCQRHEHWIVGYIGYGFISFGSAAVPSIIMTYVVDSYFPVAFEALVAVNAVKQLFAFGFSYGVIPWVTLDGFDGAFGAMAGIQFAVTLFGLVLWFFGKRLRHQSGGWKVILST